MKRVIPWLLGVLSLVLLTSCGQTVSDPKVDNWQKYQKEQSITIGFDNTFVPMGFEQKDGTYAVLILIWPIKSLNLMGFMSTGSPSIGT